MIIASIDVTLLDKSKFKQVTRKNGDKAVFCDVVLIETPQSQYGDYMVVQGLPKEERERGQKGAVLGNAKLFEASRTARPAKAKGFVEPPRDISHEPDDIPF